MTGSICCMNRTAITSCQHITDIHIEWDVWIKGFLLSVTNVRQSSAFAKPIKCLKIGALCIFWLCWCLSWHPTELMKRMMEDKQQRNSCMYWIKILTNPLTYSLFTISECLTVHYMRAKMIVLKHNSVQTYLLHANDKKKNWL